MSVSLSPIIALPDFIYFRGPYVGLEQGDFVYKVGESMLLKTVRVRDLGGVTTPSNVPGCAALVQPISHGGFCDQHAL